MNRTRTPNALIRGHLVRALVGLRAESPVQTWGLGLALVLGLVLALALLLALVQTCQASVAKGERLRALQRQGLAATTAPAAPAAPAAGLPVAARRGQGQAAPA